MDFFSNYPKILFNPDGSPNSANGKLITDISARFDFSSLNWAKNRTLYYDYEYQDIDTLDNIADRYYEDSTLHWLIILTNGILNPQFELPLNTIAFENYLNSKYKTFGAKYNISGIRYASLTPDPVYAYQKLITIKNAKNGKIFSMEYVILDKTSYDNLQEFQTEFTSGLDSFYYIVQKRQIFTILDKAKADNENKRNIKILKKEYKTNIISTVNSIIQNSK